MIKVGILGASGYTGGELLRWLFRHPQVQVTHVTSEQSAGQKVSEIHPFLRQQCALMCESIKKSQWNDVDLIFSALPHGTGIPVMVNFLKKKKNVIDLSADFRLTDSEIYEEWYKVKHPSPEYLSEAVYGLPEIFKKEIGALKSKKKGILIANPGCYATATLLASVPLLKSGFVNSGSLIVDAKSGVSGAGRKLALSFHFSEANENFSAYSVIRHRHVPEIEQILRKVTNKNIPILFVPQLIPMMRGILACVYGDVKHKVDVKTIRDFYVKFYSGHHFVRILPEGVWPQTQAVANTNFCDISIAVDEKTRKVVVFSAIDNLVKGAAGQAIQNMNLIYGWKETLGLI